jgi:hypothetical protein
MLLASAHRDRADRGLNRHVPPAQWRALVAGMPMPSMPAASRKAWPLPWMRWARCCDSTGPLAPADPTPNELPDEPS